LRDSMISGSIASTGRTGLLFTNFHRNTATRRRQRDVLSSALKIPPRNEPTVGCGENSQTDLLRARIPRWLAAVASQ
jgi:hypothetical protein